MLSFQFQLKNSFFFLLIFGLKSMKFYYIWASLFWVKKNKNKINIRNQKYEPLKCNKIDIYSNFLFGPCSHLWPTLVLFGLVWSNQVHLVHNSPIKSILFTLVHFSFIRAILSTLVQFGPFYPLQFYSVHIGLIQAIRSYLVDISLIPSILVLLSPI